MTIFRIDTETLLSAGREAEVNFKSFKKWADEMEAKRKSAVKTIPALKHTVRDLYREIDKRIQDKATEEPNKKVLKDLLQQANKMRIQLDSLLKTLR